MHYACSVSLNPYRNSVKWGDLVHLSIHAKKKKKRLLGIYYGRILRSWGSSREQASSLLTRNLRSGRCCYAILQTETPRLRDIKSLGQGHRATWLALKPVPPPL